MTAVVIDGKKKALEIRENLAREIAEAKARPVLAVVQVGDNPASQVYVRNKHKAASEIGMECRISYVPQNAGEADLRDLIIDLNDNFDVNGIIVQLPLPPQFDALQILSMISYHKDVDGFSPYNAGLLQMNNSEAVVAATPGGVYELLKDIPGGLSGKHALIIGRSNIVGRPLADLLLNHDCTVTVAHSKTVNLLLLCREADIVIAACGCPRLVKGDWIKPGAAVIDVGINRVDGKLVGDVDFDDVKEKAGFITPVPGGVGPMTVAMLLQNFQTELFAVAVAGGCIGFLIYNFYPAKVFMGDTGSMFLGGCVVAMAFGVGAPLLLGLIGLIYICESLSVVIQVISFKTTGKRIFKMSPIHHHFEMSGYTEVQIGFAFSLITVIGSLLAFLAARGF